MSAEVASENPKLKVPKLPTLKKYGLSAETWQVLADSQNQACYVCEQAPTNGRLCVDHDHVKGWVDMPPERRVLFVRGLLCFRCNTTYVGRSISIRRSQRVTAYLQSFEARKPKP